MTVAEPATRKVTKKKAVRRSSKPTKKAKASKDVSEETNVVFGDVVELPIKSIKRNPYNRHPHQSDVAELAKSIELHGQLEPCLVRKDSFGAYELISGETRWLAHKHLKRKHIFCRVGRCDDPTALKLVAAANGARKDLNPIQRAELLQQLCKPVDEGGSGLTQEEAGKLMAEKGKPMSRPAVSNAIRMLGLPHKIRNAVASGDLPETYARSVLGLFDSPVADKAEKVVLRMLKGDESISDNYRREDFIYEVEDEALEECREINFNAKPTQWDLKNPFTSFASTFFNPTEQQRTELGIFKHGKQEYCTNVKLWKELQAEAAAKLKSKKDAKQLSGATSTGDKKEKRLQQIKNKVRDWETDLKRWWCHGEIDNAVAEQLMLHVGADSLPLHEVADSMKLKLDKKNLFCEWETIAALQAKQGWRAVVARETLWPEDPDENYYIHDHLICQCADQLNYKPVDAWQALQEAGGDRLTKLLEDFYSIFTAEELADLIANLKVKSTAIVEAKTKAEMVDALSNAFIKCPPILKGK